jgi:hypothetical protein
MKDVAALRLELGDRPDRRWVAWLLVPALVCLALALAAAMVSTGQRRAAEARLARADAELQALKGEVESQDKDPRVRQRRSADAEAQRQLAFDWHAEVALLQRLAEFPDVRILAWRVSQTRGEREFQLAARNEADLFTAAVRLAPYPAFTAAPTFKTLPASASSEMPSRIAVVFPAKVGLGSR